MLMCRKAMVYFHVPVAASSPRQLAQHVPGGGMEWHVFVTVCHVVCIYIKIGEQSEPLFY